jgi:hypothetical protein
MANWADMGHAARRRMGAPSNHFESVGNMKNRNIDTPEEVLASAAHSASPRRYVGMDYQGVTNISAKPLKGKLMPKGNKQAGDPVQASKANRKNVPAGSAAQSERLGARYTVGANFPGIHSIEASATLANAKMIPSVSGKQSPNFNYGMSDSRE